MTKAKIIRASKDIPKKVLAGNYTGALAGAIAAFVYYKLPTGGLVANVITPELVDEVSMAIAGVITSAVTLSAKFAVAWITPDDIDLSTARIEHEDALGTARELIKLKDRADGGDRDDKYLF